MPRFSICFLYPLSSSHCNDPLKNTTTFTLVVFELLRVCGDPSSVKTTSEEDSKSPVFPSKKNFPSFLRSPSSSCPHSAQSPYFQSTLQNYLYISHHHTGASLKPPSFVSLYLLLAIPEIRGISVPPLPLYTRLEDSLFSLLFLPLFPLSSHSPKVKEWPRNLMISNELSHHSFVP